MKNESWKKMREDLRDEFEDLFPIDGIRPSKSGRSPALVLWAKWELVLRRAIEQERAKAFEEGRKMGQAIQEDSCNEDLDESFSLGKAQGQVECGCKKCVVPSKKIREFLKK